MFGYVRPVLDRLDEEHRDAYQSAYCGMCHALGDRHGFLARFTLQYDFTFLAILLSAGEKGDRHSCRRCPAHPWRTPRTCLCGAQLAAAADQSVILTYHKLSDDVDDHNIVAGLPYRLVRRLFRRAYRRAASARPEFDRQVREGLERLRQMEEERSPGLDRAADAFARILVSASAAYPVGSPMERMLGELLYHLGRWIYLVDAADDLPEDFASDSYNPLIGRYGLESGELTGEAREGLVVSLDHSIRLMAAAYELGDFGVWSPIIQATVYEGLFLVGSAVLEGTFQARDAGFRIPGRNKEQL